MSTTEETTRQLKVGRLIQKEISSIFLKEGSEFVAGAIVTVTKVRVAPDLGYAKIYLSVFPFERSGEYIEKISKANKQLRGMLGKRVKNQLRIIPHLSIFMDDSMEYIENIETLLK